jgi:hypothetical protein
METPNTPAPFSPGAEGILFYISASWARLVGGMKKQSRGYRHVINRVLGLCPSFLSFLFPRQAVDPHYYSWLRYVWRVQGVS